MKNTFLTLTPHLLAISAISLLSIAIFSTPNQAQAYSPRLKKVNIYNVYGGLIHVPAAQKVASVKALKRPKKSSRYILTSYTSLAELTDSSPFITANGSHVHMGTVAANCLPFGTRITIPELFGDQEFIVEDRLHPRKGCGMIDVWLPTYAEAKKFGVKHTTVNVF